MRLKNSQKKDKIRYAIKQIWQFLVTVLQWWYHISAPEIQQANASLEQREAVRRGHFTSIVIVILLIIGFGDLPAIISLGQPEITYLYMGIVAIIALTIPFNRRGKCTLAGFIIIMVVEITLIAIILVLPGGLDIATLPMFDFLIIPTLFAVSLLPAWTVFPVAISNITITYLAIFLLPKTPALQALLLKPLDEVFGIPIMLQCIIGSISFIWVRGAMKAIKEASRADTLDYLYHEQAQVAETDAITGLPNHRAIMNRLQEAIEHCKQVKEIYTLMFVDLDHFKRINDTWGHVAGDTVLREAAIRLQEALGTQGFVGRYGGEEFAILLKEAESERAYQIAERIRATLARTPCIWQADNGQEEVKIMITASIGIALYGLHGDTISTLLECADHAMYRAKQQGRNCVCVADLCPIEEQKERMQLVAIPVEPQPEAAIIQTLIAATRAHDKETGAHAQRMVALTDATAHMLGCTPEERRFMGQAAILHDIGKIGIPEAILHKEGSLSSEEWVVMRKHPSIGCTILMQAEGQLDQLAQVVEAHHERWDGQGYPLGLEGDAIPLGARIISVVDSYDAMTSTRPYRKALPREYARTELRRCAGSQYDPQVVEAFLEAVGVQEEDLVQFTERASDLQVVTSLFERKTA